MDRKIRIFSGPPDQVEELINSHADHYTPIVWNIFTGEQGTTVTCVMLSLSELRRAQLMMPIMPQGRPS